jgi:uncharacterized protein YjiS (DUF1127 family)
MSFANILSSALQRIVESDRRYREVRHIAEMDEKLLADVGLSREQLETGTLRREKLAKGVEALGRRPRRVAMG